MADSFTCHQDRFFQIVSANCIKVLQCFYQHPNWQTFWTDLCGSTIRFYKVCFYQHLFLDDCHFTGLIVNILQDTSLSGNTNTFPPATMIGPRPEVLYVTHILLSCQGVIVSSRLWLVLANSSANTLCSNFTSVPIFMFNVYRNNCTFCAILEPNKVCFFQPKKWQPKRLRCSGKCMFSPNYNMHQQYIFLYV